MATEVNTQINGIPCIARVTYYDALKPCGGSILNAPSDIDWFGYEDVEFEVLDRKGYRAEWLEKKMTGSDKNRIEAELLKQIKENAQ